MKRDEVLESVCGSKFWKDIKKDFVSEAKRVRTLKMQSEFLTKWSYYYMFETPISTVKGRGLTMRKELLKNNVDDETLLNFFKVPTATYQVISSKADEVLKNKLDENSSKESTTDYQELVERLIDRLSNNIENNYSNNNSNNSKIERELAFQKLFLVALATGRRQIEIMKMLEISKKKDEAIYRNLAKKKDSENFVIAPILFDVFKIKKYLVEIREEFKTENMTNKQINSKYNASIKKAILRYIPEIANDGFHFLRSLYAEYCYQKFAKNQDKNMYFQEVLGHEISLNSAHNYQAKVK
jgi:hypothetical protein